jgi:hypothetical protein
LLVRKPTGTAPLMGAPSTADANDIVLHAFSPDANRKETSMRSTRSIILSAALLAVLPIGVSQAGVIGPQGVGAALQEQTLVDQVQYRWGGHEYCWYPDGWKGAGWYRCGYRLRVGFGWGGPAGWHGWRWRDHDRDRVGIHDRGRIERRGSVGTEPRGHIERRSSIGTQPSGSVGVQQRGRISTEGRARVGTEQRGRMGVEGGTTGRGGPSGGAPREAPGGSPPGGGVR